MVTSSQSPVSFFTVLSAIFLVAGTCIGGGMLALPVATGLNGLLPSLSIMAICWLTMTATALCLIEVSLWMEEGAHIITMTTRILGKFGRYLAWVLYLFICYASLVAYAAGGGLQIFHGFEQHLQFPFSKDAAIGLFTVVFGLSIFLGAKIVGRLNTILFVAMIAAYFGLIGSGISEVRPNLLAHTEWRGAYLAIPLLLTSFSFQTLVPSITPLLKRNVKALRWAIIGGTTLTFAIYAAWQTLILGIVPVDGIHGLSEAYLEGAPATTCLFHFCTPWLSALAEYFAFFAIVTSFLGIALGLFDFLADGLRLSKTGLGGFLITLLILIPCYFFATYFERVFLVALDTTGGFGDTILNGMMPIMMVWIGRYRLGYTGPKFIGGRTTLSLLFVFYLAAFVLSTAVQLGAVPTLQELFELTRIPNQAEILGS